jgi:hypothetical protein
MSLSLATELTPVWPSIRHDNSGRAQSDCRSRCGQPLMTRARRADPLRQHRRHARSRPASYIPISGDTGRSKVVRTANLNPSVAVMKSAQEGV